MQDLSSHLDFDTYGADTCKKAYQYAIRILAKRDYSRHKLKTKIIDKEYPTGLAIEIVDLLHREKYLREDYYIEARIKGLLRKGMHPDFIKQKMKEEKCPINDSDIEPIMVDHELDEDKLLLDLMHKKARIMERLDQGKSDQQKREKILRFVATKGHSVSQARRVLDKHPLW